MSCIPALSAGNSPLPVFARFCLPLEPTERQGVPSRVRRYNNVVFAKMGKREGKCAFFCKKDGKMFAGSKKSRTFALANRKTGSYQSGQMGQTVNLLAYAFGGSNPSLPTQRKAHEAACGKKCRVKCGSSSVDRALAFQAGGRGFEPRLPLKIDCCYSSVVERILGKDEVVSSTLTNSSNRMSE